MDDKKSDVNKAESTQKVYTTPTLVKQGSLTDDTQTTNNNMNANDGIAGCS